MRKIFIDDLPKKEGIGANKNKMVIDWNNSVGCNIHFIYYNIEGDLYIEDYINKKSSIVVVVYNNNKYRISTSNLINCNLGKLIGKYTREFKFLNDNLKDDKRDFMILDRKYIKNKKMYKYRCNICENEGWLNESDLLNKKIGCSACSHRKVVLGINTIWDTDRWMCDLGVSEKDAKTHTRCSSQKITVTCPNCKRKKDMAISKIYNRKTISCICGDGVSYSEKFIISLLEQLNIKYIREYVPKWINNKRYDFYLPDYNCIIECHGDQHYNQTGRKGARTLEEEQYNDKYKKELAINNGVENYIVLDCRKSELKYIKNSILNSKLNVIFDISKVNWLKCEKSTTTNLVKQVCDYWNNKEEWETVFDLTNEFGLCGTTIRKYLKKGTKLGWCDYDPEKERRRH